MKKYTLIVCLLFGVFLNAQEVNYTIKNLEVNSIHQDFGITIVRDSLVVFASTRNRKSIRKKRYIANSQSFLELYKGKIGDDGEIIDVEPLSKALNSKFHDANVTFTKDYKTIYFTSGNYENKKIVKDTLGWNLNQIYKAAVYGDGEFGEIESMPFNNDNYQTGHPMLNKDETKLYFISDMPGTLGLTDIFVVDINKDGSYGEPQNLGPNVNTEGKEMFPYVDADDVLYYASDGKEDGFGGLDIYATLLVNNEAVNGSINIGEPMNSESDDFALVYRNGKSSGYFSSNREGGKGDDDVYYFDEINPIVFECNQTVIGEAKDAKSNEILINAKIEVYDKNGRMLINTSSDESGNFSFKIDCGIEYEIVGSKEDYSTASKHVVSNKQNNLAISIVLNLEPVFVEISGELILSIPSIYFDLDKSNIREDASIDLQKVIDIMNKSSEIIIEYRSHTDSRGSDSYNLKLSENRARATASWLIEHGINTSRISGNGFGETQLLNKCSNGVPCSDQEHQLNRRSEFVIMNPEVIK